MENLSLEQLVNVKVTSVSKKETDAFTSPAAISVITQDDIRRNGFTSIPDALRMVPGMDVAQINASQWAVSSRGFNDQLANKLLVLVDGRSVYTPAFSGVVWELENFVMEDLDRIEVIRGPGATLWGDNAVNGVINIITKSAKDTQGGLVSTSYGTDNQSITSVRYGGQLGTNLFYRFYMKYESEDGFLNTTGNRMPDAWDALQGGGRIDWEPNINDRFTLQGDYVSAGIGGLSQAPLLSAPYMTNISGVNSKSDGNVVGCWTHDFSSTSQLTLQGYFDRSVETDYQISSTVTAYDIDLVHRFELGSRQNIVWGAGFRDSENVTPPTFILAPNSPKIYTTIYNVFAQDDVTAVPDRLHLILGSKLDHTTYSGLELQPSGRLAWTPSETQTAWMAVSRAVTTPSLLNEAANYNASAFPSTRGPVLVSFTGNPDFEPEQELAYELGYRLVPTPKWSFDLATYYNVYKGIRRYEPGTPFVSATPTPHIVMPEIAQNALSGRTYGAEFSAQWKPVDYWRLMASYSWLHMKLSPVDTLAGDGPQNQFQIRSYLDLTHNLNLSTALSYVDRLPDVHAPSYFGLNVGLNWQINKSWEIGVFGQNLIRGGHPEFISDLSSVTTDIPRSVYVRLSWKF